MISFTISCTHDFISEMCSVMFYMISYYEISKTFHMK